MINYIKEKWENKPLQLIIAAGLFFRVLAAIFSKGYGMHDDHFLIIESAQSWVDGYDYNHWLPASGAAAPSGHSFFYCGLHFLLFKFFQFLHFDDPNGKMYVVRILHALFSMFSVILGYKIANHYSGKHAARISALLLAILWFIPMMSVRNLVEVVCVPFLLYATWLLIRADACKKPSFAFYAGLAAGLAFSVRFQSMFFLAGFGSTLLIQKKWKETFLFGISALLSMCAIQGGIDMYTWGRPFAEFQEYVTYNLNNSYSYTTLPWYNYFLTLGGLLLPPISLFLLFGFFRNWKKNVLLFLPSFIFLVFHSYFPNKQERFIFPIIPFVIILGTIGWNQFKDKSKFWTNHPKLLRGCWIFFWCINTLPLLFVTVSYSKRNRVEAMVFLQKKGDVSNIIIEDSNRDDVSMPPLFYLKKWISPFGVTKVITYDSLHKYVNRVPEEQKPNYVIFMQEENLEARIDAFKKNYSDITFEIKIEPGALDKLLHFLNPKNNENYTSTIYKIQETNNTSQHE